MKNPLKKSIGLVVGFTALAFATGLNAAEVTWVATANGAAWAAGATWIGGTVPGANDLAVFPGDVNTSISKSLTHAQTTQIGAIIVTSGTSTRGHYVQSSATTGNGTKLVLNGYDTTIGGESMKLLVGNQAKGTIFINRDNNALLNVTLGTSGVVYVGAGATVKFISSVHDGGNGYSITKKGEGVLSFGDNVDNSNNTFSGGLILESGTLDSFISTVVTNGTITNGPFGTGTLTLRGGSLLTQSTVSRNYANAVALDGTTTLGGAWGTSTRTGQLTFGSGAGKTTTILRDSELIVQNYTLWQQSISGDYGLKKSGAGVLNLTSASDYFGDTIVKEGALYVNNDLLYSAVQVNSGARLGGRGTIYENIHVVSGGTLAPGMASTVALTATTAITLDTRGTLTTYGDITLDAGSTLEFTLASTASYDQIRASGGVSLDGAVLNLILNYEPMMGDTFLLIANEGFDIIDGQLTYNGKTLADDAVFAVTNGTNSQKFLINYNYSGGGYENSLAITAVPEPSTMALLGIAGGAIAMMARRRSRSATK